METKDNAAAEQTKDTKSDATAEDSNNPVAQAQADDAKAKQSQSDSKPEATVSEAFGQESEPQERTVPEAVFLEYKSTAKKQAKEIAELQAKLQNNDSSKSDARESAKELAKKWDVDVEFIEDMMSRTQNESSATIRQELEKEFQEKLKPLQESANEAKAAKLDKVFNEHYAKTLEAMPEYKDIANKDVVKALALDPKNANKTFGKILEDAFGHLVTGRATIDSANPGSGKGITEIDFDKASKDSEYFSQIMASPELKKKYNESLESRLNL